MDVQAVDLEVLDLEVSDNRSPDRKPANGQGAESTGANGRCADRGRAKANRSKLHRDPLLPTGWESGKGPRERSTVVHEAPPLPGKNLGVMLAAGACLSTTTYHHWLARMPTPG